MYYDMEYYKAWQLHLKLSDICPYTSVSPKKAESTFEPRSNLDTTILCKPKVVLGLTNDNCRAVDPSTDCPYGYSNKKLSKIRKSV